MEADYDSLLRDKTHPSRIPPLASGITERVDACGSFSLSVNCLCTLFDL
jgi:hypothetical protein